MKHTGRVLPVPLGLIESGPLIEVTLGPPLVVAEAIKAAGQEVETLNAKLMIDTGAQVTVVDNTIPEALGLVPERFHPIIGVSQVPEDCPVYRMSIAIGFESHGKTLHIAFESDIVGGKSGPIHNQHVGLLGRDLLAGFQLAYNGPAGTFDLIVSDHVMTSVRASLRPPDSRGGGKKKRRR